MNLKFYYKRISGHLTNEQSKRVQDYLNLKRGLKTRYAYPRNAYKGFGYRIAKWKNI